ncbi:hypothetical protein HYALB_00008413 [Hymenoscyphus albidus]|uniref:FAD-binding PCMH-type domain-containing protein n=1 Tax=Hymenoscyphus albidus TaxID=595503 RepID=A0A9N9LNN9_9HELO|nr:hypothetical protein HYALB_00008413 [Hymenoscyphus albidus]
MVSLMSNMVTTLPSMVPMGSYDGMSSTTSCRCFLGDACWPSSTSWQSFNSSIGGNLIASVPIAAVCHDYSTSNSSATTFDANACQSLEDSWFYPSTHLPSSSSAMGAPIFANNSCNPFLPRSSSCTLGNYVKYSVKVTGAADVQKTIAFAAERNIRLVIRSTGHDYNGKSIGAGALSIWIQELTSAILIDSYEGPLYSGRAIKFGSGVSVLDAYKFVDMNKGIIVGGACPTVTLAGGYTQGGGHGPLAGTFGLAADNVVEWEVISATGELLKVSSVENSDLYWALCGEGGGTYGVVISITVKLHDPMLVAAASLSFSQPATATGAVDFWNVVSTFIESLPAMTDAGLEVIWTVLPGTFVVSPATAPGLTKEELNELFGSSLSQLKESNVSYNYQSALYQTFLDSYSATVLPSSNISNSIIGSRMIPRSVVEDNLPAFVTAIQDIIASNFLFVGLTLNVSHQNPDAVAANSYWRKTLTLGTLGTFFDYQNFEANFANQNTMTNTLIPKLAALTPNEAAYLTEGDFQQPNWQEVFYGDHYQKLDAIKAKYDPHDIHYVLGAVGSDRWTQKEDGRLCRA